MALSSKVGTITQPGATGNQSYTGMGFRPKALIFFLTQQSSRKVMQLASRPQVGLTIISANCYLVITGFAHISRESCPAVARCA